MKTLKPLFHAFVMNATEPNTYLTSNSIQPIESNYDDLKMTFNISIPNETLTLPIYKEDIYYGINLEPYIYDFYVDWGDGSPISHVIAWNDSNKSHTYSESGIYQVTISGTCQALSNYESVDQDEFVDYLVSVDQIGSTGLLDLSDAFITCDSLVSVNMFGNLSTLNNIAYTFKNCEILTSIDLSMCDLSQIESMDATFLNCFTLDTINFTGTTNTKNVWFLDTFNDCRALTALDLSGFTGLEVSNISFMCYNCQSLTTLDLSNWVTPNLYRMVDTFHYCINLTTIDISNFITTTLQYVDRAFRDCISLTTEMSADMFWNNPSITDHYETFLNCNAITNYDDIQSDWK